MQSSDSYKIKEGSEFLNKKIVITGASSGIGLSASIYFLNCGAKVIMAGKDLNTMYQLCQKFKFFNAIIMKLELESDISIYDFKTSVVERFKTIDILINCAGIKLDGDLEKTYPQDFDYTLDINLRSLYYLINNLSGFMEKNSSIINLSCLYGTYPMAGLISHNVSKAGVESLTRYAAAEFAIFGIRVNAITACPVETNSFRFLKLSEKEIEQYNKKMEKYIPMGRIGRPDDITKVIAFLASSRSQNITGQIIRVDGGRGLTSSGYVHYKGLYNMNSRFEPDGIKRNLDNFFGLKDYVKTFKKEEIPKDEKELKKFINDKIKESKFSTNLSDAFMQNNYSYKKVDNDDHKFDKFLKGETINPSYIKKKNKNMIKTNNTTSLNININNNMIQNNSQIRNNKSYNIELKPNRNNIIYDNNDEPNDTSPRFK